LSEEKKVSAIIVNWNGRKFLPSCLDSVLRQSYRNMEVLVVDCASTDQSVPFVKNHFPSAKVIELKQDFGPPHAINLAVRQARGEFILILNNDVILPENTLSLLVEEIEKDRNCVINPVELSAKGQYRQAGCTDPWISHLLCRIFPVPGQGPSYPTTACCLVSKDILRMVPLNENLFLYEDTEWGWRLHLQGIKLKVMLNASFLHEGEGTVKSSHKSDFVNGRTPIATLFICFRWSTLLVLMPFLLISYYLNPRRIGYLMLKGRLFFFLKGVLSFFGKLPLFVQDRKRAQTNRKMKDGDLLRVIIGSVDFQKKARESWSILNGLGDRCVEDREAAIWN
jgi:GT2 family glycosyltransferase